MQPLKVFSHMIIYKIYRAFYGKYFTRKMNTLFMTVQYENKISFFGSNYKQEHIEGHEL